MDREEELLELIASAPEVDAHRLVYADLLSERGDPRGEFIAIQLKKGLLTDEERLLERELRARHGAEWLGPLASVVESSQWKRGFLHACTVRFDSTHQMEELAQSRHWATVERLAGDVHFAGIGAFRSLRVLGPCELAQLTPLWRHAAVPSIVELMVQIDELSPDDARFLGDARPFPRLKHLGLIEKDRFAPKFDEDALSPHSLRFLLAGRRARKLEKLAIRARATYSAQHRDLPPRPELAIWWEVCREMHELKELLLEPSHGIRYRFFREREAWSLEIQWRSEYATADLTEIEASLRAVPETAFHRVVVRQIGVELPHHRRQLNRVLGRFPRLVFFESTVDSRQSTAGTAGSTY